MTRTKQTFYRSTDVRIWQDRKFRAITPNAKLIFWYSFSNAHGHVSGLYYLPVTYIMADVGLGESEIRQALQELEDHTLLHYDDDNEWIFVPNMLKHQGRNGSTETAARRAFEHCDSIIARAWFATRYPELISIIPQNETANNESRGTPCPHSVDTPCRPETETETETETEQKIEELKSSSQESHETEQTDFFLLEPTEPGSSAAATVKKTLTEDDSVQVVETNEAGVDCRYSKKIPPCPHKQILALWSEVLPTMPQPNPELWNGTRERHLKARWKQGLVTQHSSGERMLYHDTDTGLTWWRRYFEHIADSKFLMNHCTPFQREGIGWCIKAENFRKILEGKYS